jgi:acyl carrier protein
MTQEDVIPRLKKLMTERLRLAPERTDSLEPDSLLLKDGLGLDSLDCIELLLGIEDEFELEFNEEQESWMESFTSLATLSQLVLYTKGEVE